MACKECYSEKSRITPILGARECLKNHLQYVCGTCGRCICINKDDKRGLYRWNFPFKGLSLAKLYLRTADYLNKRPCSIYEVVNSKGRKSYKIFANANDLNKYLLKNKGKTCKRVFSVSKYKEYIGTHIKYLAEIEVEEYLKEMKMFHQITSDC